MTVPLPSTIDRKSLLQPLPGIPPSFVLESPNVGASTPLAASLPPSVSKPLLPLEQPSKPKAKQPQTKAKRMSQLNPGRDACQCMKSMP